MYNYLYNYILRAENRWCMQAIVLDAAAAMDQPMTQPVHPKNAVSLQNARARQTLSPSLLSPAVIIVFSLQPSSKMPGKQFSSLFLIEQPLPPTTLSPIRNGSNNHLKVYACFKSPWISFMLQLWPPEVPYKLCWRLGDDAPSDFRRNLFAWNRSIRWLPLPFAFSSFNRFKSAPLLTAL